MRDIAIYFVLFKSLLPHLILAVEWLLKTSALFLLGMAFASFLRNRSARARCWIWRLMFVALALLPIAEFGPGIVKRLRPKIAVPVPMEAHSSFQKRAEELHVMRSGEEISQRVAQRKQAFLDSRPAVPPPWEGEIVQHGPVLNDYRTASATWVELALPWAWGIGASVALLWLFIRTAASLRWLRAGATPPPEGTASAIAVACEMLKVHRRPSVRLSPKLAAPLLFGLARPLIYLPVEAGEWSRERLLDVLLHELAHWRRRDLAWLHLGRVLVALFWWNPCFRYALRNMIEAAEEAADDIVLLCQRPASAYAQTLVEVAARAHIAPPQGGLPMIGYRTLEKRINSLMRENRWRGRLGKLASLLIVVVLVAGASIASISIGIPSPVATASVAEQPMTKEQQALAKRIITNNKKRLEALRYVHAKVEGTMQEEGEGKVLVSPMPSQLEIWWDTWARSYRAEYRPMVTRWISGSADFSVKNETEISDGKEAFTLSNGTERGPVRPSRGDQFSPDFLFTHDAETLVRVLTMLSEKMSMKGGAFEYILRMIEWHNKEAVEYVSRYLTDGEVDQEQRIILSPQEDDLILHYQLSFPKKEKKPALQKRVESVERASNGVFYGSSYSNVSRRDGKKTTYSYKILSLEPLARLPERVLDVSPDPEEQFIARGGTAAVQPKEIVLHCVDHDDDSPVGGTKVAVRINNRKAVNRQADEKGVLAVKLPEREVTSLSFRASKPGFAPRIISWSKREDPLNLPGTYEVKLAKSSPISGRVVDEEGNGIAGADVRIFFTGTQRRWRVYIDSYDLAGSKAKTKTDADGHWSLPDFPTELDGLLYRISHPDYQATTDHGIADFRTSTGLPYTALRDGTAIVTLKNGNTLRGTITDSDGQPIDNCRVVIGKDIHGSNPPTTHSAASGEYRLVGLQDGPTWITLESPHHRPVAREITLPLAGPLDFRLEKGGIVRGRVVKEDGTPSTGLNVGVDGWNKLRTLAFSTQTDAGGNFLWRGAPEEAVEFVFGACQNREFLAEIPLSPREEVQTIVMKPALQLSGTVVDAETGNPVPGATMTYAHYWGPGSVAWQTREARTLPDGKFEWKTDRFGGSYLFRFEAPGYKPFESEVLTAKQQVEQLRVKLKKQ